MTIPSITVVVPTCGRPTDIEACFDSLALVRYESWNVLVIDQSDDLKTEERIRRHHALTDRLLYVRTDERGLSRARNRAMHIGNAEIFAFLDDDCTVQSDWLSHVADTFSRYPDAAIVFGSVEDGLHDPEYFVPTYHVPEERAFTGKDDFLSVHGIGAGMYLRPALCRDVGPFDIYAGAGGLLGAGEETDFVYRALAIGRIVVETPAIAVTHHGARSHAAGEARQLVRKYNHSQGALDMKYLRCGHWSAASVVVSHVAERVSVMNIRRIVFGGGPTYLASLIAYLLGFFESVRIPVIRRDTLWGQPDDYRDHGTRSMALLPAETVISANEPL